MTNELHFYAVMYVADAWWLLLMPVLWAVAWITWRLTPRWAEVARSPGKPTTYTDIEGQ